METILKVLIDFLSIELLGAIPVGIFLGLSLIHSDTINFIGSMTLVLFVLFTVRPVFKHLLKTKTG